MGNRETAITDLLKQWKKEFDQGETVRFLSAMQLCMTFDVPIPDWAAWHFQAGAGRYMSAEAKTLDDAFLVHRPKSWHQNKARARRGRGLVVHIEARYLTSNGASVEDAIAKVALNNHMDESTAERWYYDKQLLAEFGAPQNIQNSEDDS